MPTLTDTEIKIAICLTDSQLHRKDIAVLCKISINTVNSHIKSIFQKLETDNRYGMVCAFVQVYPQYREMVHSKIFRNSELELQKSAA